MIYGSQGENWYNDTLFQKSWSHITYFNLDHDNGGVQVKIWEAREVLRTDRPFGTIVTDRTDAPTMPISTRFEGKAHGATGDAPIAVRPGEEIEQIRTGGVIE